MKKPIRSLSFLLAACALCSLASYAGPGEHHHDHHETKQAGPNGGRLITSVTPHAEFLLTAERYAQITFLDEQLQAIAPSGQSVSLVGGDRQNPVRIDFQNNGQALLSQAALPEGKNLPLILSIQTDADAKPIRERFHLNLSPCPECDYQEYACICSHGSNEHAEHAH